VGARAPIRLPGALARLQGAARRPSARGRKEDLEPGRSRALLLELLAGLPPALGSCTYYFVVDDNPRLHNRHRHHRCLNKPLKFSLISPSTLAWHNYLRIPLLLLPQNRLHRRQWLSFTRHITHWPLHSLRNTMATLGAQGRFTSCRIADVLYLGRAGPSREKALGHLAASRESKHLPCPAHRPLPQAAKTGSIVLRLVVRHIGFIH
jgi:hypothetical protein